jgi:hypothetical protein
MKEERSNGQVKYEESEDPNASFCVISKIYFYPTFLILTK